MPPGLRPHELDIVLHRRRQVVARPQAGDAFLVFGVLLRVAALERVAAGPGVGVDQPVGLVLFAHVAQDLREHEVLEDVGMVACVEGVSVGEHGGVGKEGVGINVHVCYRPPSRR